MQMLKNQKNKKELNRSRKTKKRDLLRLIKFKLKRIWSIINSVNLSKRKDKKKFVFRKILKKKRKQSVEWKDNVNMRLENLNVIYCNLIFKTMKKRFLKKNWRVTNGLTKRYSMSFVRSFRRSLNLLRTLFKKSNNLSSNKKNQMINKIRK